MFIDDRPVREGFVCKVCQKSSLLFSYQLVHIRGLHAKGFIFLRFYSFSLSFFKNGRNGRHGYSLKDVAFFKNIDGSVKLSLLLGPKMIFLKISEGTIRHL